MSKITHSDALILYAVAYCSQHAGKATLEGIYAATDAIYRIAPTFHDLQVGLTRLLTCNYLTDNGYSYLPTEEGISLYHEVNESDGNVFDHLDLLVNKMNAYSRNPEVDKKVTLDPVLVEQARKSYYGN